MVNMDYIRANGIPEWTDRLLQEVVQAQPKDITLFSVSLLAKWLLESSDCDSLLKGSLACIQAGLELLRKCRCRMDEIKLQAMTSGPGIPPPDVPVSIDTLFKANFFAEGMKGVANDLLPQGTGWEAWKKLYNNIDMARGRLAGGCLTTAGKSAIPFVSVNNINFDTKRDGVIEVYEELNDKLKAQFPADCSVLVTDAHARVLWANHYFKKQAGEPVPETLQDYIDTFATDVPISASVGNSLFRDRNKAMFHSAHNGALPWQLSPPNCDHPDGAVVYCSNYFPYVTKKSRIPVLIGIARVVAPIDTIHSRSWHVSQTFDSSPGFTTLYNLDNGEVVLQNYGSALMMVPFTNVLATSNLGVGKAMTRRESVTTDPLSRFLPHCNIPMEERKAILETLRAGKSVIGKKVQVSGTVNEVLSTPRRASTAGEEGDRWHVLNCQYVEAPQEGCVVGRFAVVNELDITGEEKLKAALQKTVERVKKERQHAQNEQQKTSKLMQSILPLSIISRLSQNEKVISDKYSDVSLLFADIVGFTGWSSTQAPIDVVRTLHSLISQLDDLAEALEVEKIKTIGDCYFAAAGCPTPAENHAEKILRFAGGLMQIAKLAITDTKGLDMRVGIHSGEVVGGVIGKHKFVFDLWGDAVNTASRMESTGLPGKIQISSQTKRLVEHMSSFLTFEERTVEAKGKGTLTTYIVSCNKEMTDDATAMCSLDPGTPGTLPIGPGQSFFMYDTRSGSSFSSTGLSDLGEFDDETNANFTTLEF